MRFLILLLVFYLPFIAMAQQKAVTPPDDFDFWVGNWEVSWKNADGSTTVGTNTINRTLDGRVLQEHFQDTASGFKGTSITVWHLADSSWHQAWADNRGGYFNFVGRREGEKRIFQTPVADKRGIIWRMIFFDISPNHFTWDWQGSKDNGKTWDLMWRINYKRKAESSK